MQFLILLFLFPFLQGHSISPEKAFSILGENEYGFLVIDLGIKEEDLLAFRSLDVKQPRIYDQFGNLHELDSGLTRFLDEIGDNSNDLKSHLHASIISIVNQIMAASKEETAWVSLRASPPTHAWDLSRWHFDGYSFTLRNKHDLMCKVVVTLVGASTLFYELPTHLRRFVWSHIPDRLYMHNFCEGGPIVSPKQGEGVLFLGGPKSKAALHSEPPIQENRLFFSMVPCDQKQLIDLQKRVIPFN